MATSMTDRKSPTSLLMRKRFGSHLRQMREEAGLTQRDIAAHLGYDYYTQVSQIERGLGRVPPEDIGTWAKLLKQDPKDFAKLVLYWTDPFIYQALYGINPYDDQKLPRPPSK